MKVFLREICLDIRQGIFKEYKKYIPVVLLGVFYCATFIMNIKKCYDKNLIPDMNFTLADIVLYFFRGKQKIILNNKIEKLELPLDYMMMNLYLMYLIGDYVVRDILSFGKTVLVRTKKRLYWWLSKCIWCVTTVLIFYGILYLCMFVCTLVVGTLSMKPDVFIAAKVCNFDISQQYFFVDVGKLMRTALILPIITSISMMLAQMAVAIIILPIIGYVMNVVVLIVSAYYMTPFLQGNALMILRSADYKSGGIDTAFSIGISLVIIIVSVLAGAVYFSRMDILKKGWKL